MEKDIVNILDNLELDVKNLDDVFKHVIHLLEQIHDDINYYHAYSTILNYCKNKNVCDKVRKLMMLPQPEQRTKAWYDLRKGMMTASTDIRNALGLNKYDKNCVTTLILKKCGYEKNPFTGNIYTEWGVKYEPIATQLYEFRKKTQVIEFGLIQHPVHKFIGASPDGITPKGTMLEIKCPYRRKITGVVPDYYWIQMQTQLEVCDLDVCDFLECNFCEYETDKCFFEDVNKNDDRKTLDGMEKGVFAEMIDSNDKISYIYPKMEWTTKYKLRWLDKQIKNSTKKLNKMIYWSLSLYSCVKVDRDKKWWNEQLPKLKNVWDRILYHRKHGHEELIKEVQKKNKTVVTITFDNNKTIQNECLFSDTDN